MKFNSASKQIKIINTKKLITRSITLIVAITLVSWISLSPTYILQNSSNTSSETTSTPTLNIIAPSPNTYIAGNFKLVANLSNTNVGSYNMFWYVDNGQWNWMNNSPFGQNNKQATINVSSWTWHLPSTSYTIDFVAVLNSNVQRIYGSVPINVGNAPVTTTIPTATSSTATTTPLPTSTTSTEQLYVNPNNNAAQTAASTTDPTMKSIMTKLAATPTATWFGNWNSNIQSDVNTLVTNASKVNQIPVLVAYNIPQRDCGGYSSGGATTPANYEAWIQGFANGIGNHSAIVILEPDALAQISCLSSTNQAIRYQLLNFAVKTLKANPGTKVYIDAGNPSWINASTMATRLLKAGVASSNGFSLNVSNFIATNININYGNQISSLIGNKHFVIDTSRNGNGSNGQWCNPSGMALGNMPTANTGYSNVDYYLWIKTPGQSDGTCNGGPAAGTWWPSYAETLAINAGW